MTLKSEQLLVGIIILIVILLVPALITVFYSQTPLEVKEEADSGRSLRLKIEETGEVKTIDLEKYIEGVVAAEMPASYNIEALKAQAVAARTYTYRKLITGTKIMSSDYRVGQAYLTEEQLKSRWGEHYLDYMSKVKKAVGDTEGQILVYNDEPIEAVYHAISAGKTQGSQDIWNFELPYLTSVESPFDLEASQYETSFNLTDSEARKLLLQAKSSISLTDDPLVTQMKVIGRNAGGYIIKAQVGNIIMTGEELRNAFGTRSSNMQIAQKGDVVTITTRGYGHGVGMSQNGANEMAKNKKNYEEILTHYYVGTKLMKLK